jgi:hypothetical protein
MTTYLKVENNSSLVRDISSNAIVNRNTDDYEQYMRNKQLAAQRMNKINEQDDQINNLKQDMAELKDMVAALLKNKED